nr:MAG TPA: Protein of unknown function (DUF3408) [Caudoviricetes sp.]
MLIRSISALIGNQRTHICGYICNVLRYES